MPKVVRPSIMPVLPEEPPHPLDRGEKKVFGVQLTVKTWAELDRMARWSGRSRNYVIKRLLLDGIDAWVRENEPQDGPKARK